MYICIGSNHARRKTLLHFIKTTLLQFIKTTLDVLSEVHSCRFQSKISIIEPAKSVITATAVNAGANPTITSCNASVVKNYNAATSSIALF
jgi:hypothetical protein